MSELEQFQRVVVESTAERATWFTTEIVKSVICEAVDLHGLCHVALAGGTTPHGLYLMLAGAAVTGDVPWRDVEVFFGDERDVSHDDIESNSRMVRETLLDHVPIDPQRVHPMPADAQDLDAAAGDYERTIRQIVPVGRDNIPRFDLILLGMGGEGHTASLFPETEILDETDRLVASYFVPVLGRQRMTFTFPLINAARNVLLLVTGADKADAVARLLGDDDEARRQLPAARIAPTDGKVILVLDEAAGKQAGRTAPDHS